jgi:aspartyl-tRNA(Asn)/glutamyl-tRNA(Gln) amidotransferase subunit A
VSRYGLVAFASSLDQAGPIARTAADLAVLLDGMAGFDERDSTSVQREKEKYALQIDLKGLRIGLPREYFTDGLQAEVRAAVDAAVAWFKSQGAKIIELELPHTKVGVAAYYVIAPAEASSNLSRFDGVRYGHRAKEYNDLVDMYCRTRAEGFGAEVKRRILVGTYVLSHGYYDAYYLHAQKIRRLIAQDFTRAFEKCDLILGPTAPTTAYELGAKSEDPVQMYLGDIFTIPAPLAGLPALSIPCGFDAKGLPVGLQLTGRHFAEGQLLAAAHRYQQATDWHARVPKETPL